MKVTLNENLVFEDVQETNQVHVTFYGSPAEIRIDKEELFRMAKMFMGDLPPF